jgi:hypothetical protein
MAEFGWLPAPKLREYYVDPAVGGGQEAGLSTTRRITANIAKLPESCDELISAFKP